MTKKKAKPQVSENRHHLLYPKNLWGKHTAKKLHNVFVRYLDVGVHSELHYHAVRSIPLPPQEQLVEAWQRYQQDRDFVDNLPLLGALWWLIAEIPDRDFREAMTKQARFIQQRLGQ